MRQGGRAKRGCVDGRICERIDRRRALKQRKTSKSTLSFAPRSSSSLVLTRSPTRQAQSPTSSPSTLALASQNQPSPGSSATSSKP